MPEPMTIESATGVHTVLLVAERLRQRHAARNGVRRSIRQLRALPPILLNKLWCGVCMFFCRPEWRT